MFNYSIIIIGMQSTTEKYVDLKLLIKEHVPSFLIACERWKLVILSNQVTSLF